MAKHTYTLDELRNAAATCRKLADDCREESTLDIQETKLWDEAARRLGSMNLAAADPSKPRPRA